MKGFSWKRGAPVKDSGLTEADLLAHILALVVVVVVIVVVLGRGCVKIETAKEDAIMLLPFFLEENRIRW